MVRVTVELPRACADWLEREALRRKQEHGAPRMAKSPIVVELIERAMRAPAAAPKKARNGKRNGEGDR